MIRIMNTILSPYHSKFVWIYLDNILNFSNSYKEYLQHLRQIFKKLEEHNFYLRMDKCNLMVDEIEELGHMIKENKIMPSREKIVHIMNFTLPKNRKQLLQFLGSVNYIGSHLTHIATLQGPLTELTGIQQWEWGQLQDNALTKLKLHVSKICRYRRSIMRKF